jgi:hypothetical protein
MKNTFKAFLGIAALILVFSACKKQDYSIGDLTAPSNIVINTELVGQDVDHPNGDGSGDVKISITADNALSYNIDYDANDAPAWVHLTSESITRKFTTLGLTTYRLTALVYGKGGTSSTLTKDITVRFDYAADPAIITALTGDASKTWVVDKSVPGHMGVGPWDPTSVNPSWWAAAINEKLTCCPCFYDAHFTFTKIAATKSYTLTVATEGAFTKTGSLTTLPGIPASGDEGCYSYSGGTSSFAFIPSSSGVPAIPVPPDPANPSNNPNSPSTQTSILLSGFDTYIGYGAVQKEYEILVITDTYLYLRVQGTETGNAWYLKLKAL